MRRRYVTLVPHLEEDLKQFKPKGAGEEQTYLRVSFIRWLSNIQNTGEHRCTIWGAPSRRLNLSSGAPSSDPLRWRRTWRAVAPWPSRWVGSSATRRLRPRRPAEPTAEWREWDQDTGRSGSCATRLRDAWSLTVLETSTRRMECDEFWSPVRGTCFFC